MDEDLNFDKNGNEDLTICEVLNFPPDGAFYVTGQLKWLEYAKTINVRGYDKKLGEGKIIDSSNFQIPITVWSQVLYKLIEKSSTYQFVNLAVSWCNGQMKLATTETSRIVLVW